MVIYNIYVSGSTDWRTICGSQHSASRFRLNSEDGDSDAGDIPSVGSAMNWY